MTGVRRMGSRATPRMVTAAAFEGDTALLTPDRVATGLLEGG